MLPNRLERQAHHAHNAARVIEPDEATTGKIRTARLGNTDNRGQIGEAHGPPSQDRLEASPLKQLTRRTDAKVSRI